MNNRVLYLLSGAALCLSLKAESISSDKSVQESVYPLCQLKCDKNITDTPTEVHCREDDRHIFGRCCVITKLGTVIGVDLQKCKLTEQQFSKGVENMTKLLYISLQGNELANITKEDFHRNTEIIYLSLPGNLNCPGSHSAWNKSSSTGQITECFDELNICKVYNVSCPDNSQCEPSGIDQVECLCKEGYHGYKCMNTGTFPTMEFVLGLTIPTIVISALLWVTQRRYVKTNNKNK